jgi:RNA polymerase sigma-70 factor (ECF subfamily)
LEHGFSARFSDKTAAQGTIYNRVVVVSHLRLVPSPSPGLSADEACLDAFQRELDYVYRTLRRLGTAPSEVDDLAQEVFLALRRSWNEYERKRRREVAFGVVEVGDAGPGPDDAVQSKQARALVLAALERIPLPRRAVLVMHDIDDVPVGECASVLDIPMFTVYSRLRKARRELEAAVRRMMKEGDGR